MLTKTNSFVHKLFILLVMLGLVLANLGGMGVQTVHAQAVGTETPTPDVMGTTTSSGQESPIFFDNLKQLSPNSKYIALVSANNLGMVGSTIWTQAVDGTDRIAIIRGDEQSWITNPIWSPDSTKLAYLKVIQTQESQFEVGARYEIWAINTDGSNNVMLTNTLALKPALGYGGETNITWPTANQIIFYDNTVFPTKQYSLNVNTLSITEIGIVEPPDVVSQSQPSNVPYFNQGNSAWGSNQLGTGACNTTIRTSGCAVTATAMVFKYFGVNIDPGALNSWLTNHSGYQSGCLLVWATAANISQNITWIGTVGQDFNRLRSELDLGYPVIVEVNNNGTQHFVVVVGYSNNTYYINDPAYSTRTTLASYGNAFVGMRIYHGSIGSGGGGSLNPPTLLSPSNGQTLSSRSVHFTWQSPNATNQNGFTFRLSTNSNPDSQPWIVDTGLGNNYSNYDNNFSSDGTFYWHMRTWNSSGQASSWITGSFVIDTSGGGTSSNCPVYNFDGVVLWDQDNCYGTGLTINGSTGVVNLTDYSWNDRAQSIYIHNGWSMRVWQDTNAGLASSCIYGSKWDLTQDKYDTNSNRSMDIDISSIQVFQNSSCTGNPAPSAPSLSGPGNSSNNPYNYNLNFQWNSSSGASEYLLEWWGGPYSTMQPCGWSSSTSCAVGPVAAGNTYSWHVKARNGSGESGWSDTWSFTVQSQSQPPSAPSLSNPGNGSSNPYDYDLNFQWNSSSGAAEYLVEWWGGPYSTMQPCGWSSSTSCHIGPVATGNTYSWHVKARNGSGESGWSDTWSFSVQSQSLPVSAEFDTWPPSGDAPFTTALHIVDMSNITSCLWDYGDGQTDTVCTQLHNHTYYNPGLYTVSLTVNGPGTSDYTIRTDYIAVSDPAAPPTPPSDLAITNPTTDSLTLNWQDNASTETGFKIYRWGYDGTNWTFIYLATVGADVTSYTQSGLDCGSDFNYYEVSAYNDNGESAHAGWVQGTTSTCSSSELSITGLTLFPDTAYTNDNIDIKVDLQNSSSVDAGPFWIDVYVDGQPTGCQDWGSYFVRTNGLAAGTTDTQWLQIPAGNLAAGSHAISAFVDSGCEVAENDENNNVAGPSSLSLSNPPPAPAHDDFGAATSISPIAYTNIVDVSGATMASDDPAVSSSSCDLAPGLASVWYKYTSPVNRVLTLDTFGSDYDTYIAVWTGSRGNLTSVGCNDDSHVAGNPYQSKLQISFAAGTTYYIEIAQYNGSFSTSALEILPRTKLRPGQEIQSEANPGQESSIVKPMPTSDVTALAGGTLNFHVTVYNDDFGNAQVIASAPYGVTQNTIGASTALDDPSFVGCPASLGKLYNSVWYTFTPPASRSYLIDTLGSTYDTVLGVWRGSRGALISVGCNDDSTVVQSSLTLSLVGGQKYYLEVAGYDAASMGSLALHVRPFVSTPFVSIAAQDGWVLESSELSNIGSTLNSTATTFVLGDNAARKQYRSILSFNTSAIPDNAVITGVILKVKLQAIVGGGNPVSIFQGFMADIKNGFFGTAALQTTDFQTVGNGTYGPFVLAPVSSVYNINLTGGKALINKLATNSGLTQIRLRFKLDDNNNAVANYLSLYGGNATTAADRPQLVITYYVP